MAGRNTSGETLTGDVVIVGYGGAGASAAIVAHDLGASVIILEKMASGGGNTRLGASSFFTPPKDMRPQAVEHLEKLCFGNTPREVIEAYVEESLKNKEWIEQMGGTVQVTLFKHHRWPQVRTPAWPNIPGAEAMVNSFLGNDVHVSGAPLWSLLSGNVEKRGIKVLTSTQAKELITNEKNEVVGVIAEGDGQEISIRARKAVILTTGGFASNQAMREEYLPYKPFFPKGSPGNTGDGIIMAQNVGAALWHMTVVKAGFSIKTAEYESPFDVRFASPRFIYVNRGGRRFTNETGWETHFVYLSLMHCDPLRPDYPQLPVYGIFDKENIKEALDPGYNTLNQGYKWSKDNSAELAKGWIRKGETIAELAKKLSMDETALSKTIFGYNEYCKMGMDAEFGRSRASLAPIDSVPFYAVEFWPRLTNTLGGPRRDPKARVIDNSGKPIPRLYSAGEMGSFFGFLYSGGGGVGEPMAVGRIAGRNAAAEKPLN